MSDPSPHQLCILKAMSAGASLYNVGFGWTTNRGPEINPRRDTVLYMRLAGWIRRAPELNNAVQDALGFQNRAITPLGRQIVEASDE